MKIICKSISKIILLLMVLWSCAPVGFPTKPISESEGIIEIDFANELTQSPDYFGTNGWWTDQDAKILRSRYEELGARVIRIPIIQGIIEPSNDNDNPDKIKWNNFYFDKPYPFHGKTVTYRKWFECMRDLKVKIMIHFPYISGWLSKNGDKRLRSTYPPKDYDEYREFIYVVLHYLVVTLDYPAEDILLEPINEPDLRCGQDKLVPCFWENWYEEDIVKVFLAACEARNRVSSKISIVGLSECCGVKLSTKFLEYYNGGNCLDAISYHSYVMYDFQSAIKKGNILKKYEKPVIINEYGNRLFWSNGIEGAIWHSYALSLLWKSNINPMQFPISEFRGNGNDYRELGLFKDWTEKWEIKPAFWVYRNFYRYLTNGIVVWTKTELPLEVLAVKSNNFHNRLIVCITNLEERNYKNIKIVIYNLPYENARVDVNNNLLNKSHIKTLSINGELAVIEDDILGKSSSCYIIEENNK